MGEWIRNISLLNGKHLTADFLLEKTKQLELQQQLMESPETFIYYAPNAKWIYIYSNCLVIGEHRSCDNLNTKLRGYQQDIATIARHFRTTAISNHVYASSELILSMSRQGEGIIGQDDIYVVTVMEEDPIDYPSGYSSLRNRDMDTARWEGLLARPLVELQKALRSGESATDRYLAVGRCLGYDRWLSIIDHDHHDDLLQLFPEKSMDYTFLSTRRKA